MKRILGLFLALIMLLSAVPAFADDVRTSGLYTYEIKGNGTITIIDFDWRSNSGDVYIPNMLDGYMITAISDEAFAEDEYNDNRPECIVTLPNSITMIGEKAFMNASVSAVNIPANTQYIGIGAFANCPLKQFSVAPDNSVYATINGVLYNKTTKTLVAYPREAGRINIPDGIVKIDDYAFYGVSLGSFRFDRDGMWSIGDMLPSSIVEIGNYAFAESKLGIISLIPSSVTKIGDYAFANSHLYYPSNPNLASIPLGKANASIGRGAFQNATIEGKHVKTVLACGQSIGDDAFNGLRFSQMTYPILILGNEMASIGRRAFMNVAFDIYMPGGFKVSSIGEEAFSSSKVFMERNPAYNLPLIDKVQESTFTFPEGVSVISKNAFNNGFESSRGVAHLIIPEGVTIIEEGAFANNEKLKTLQLPTTLTSIKTSAFQNTSISSVEIPISVTEIGEDAFDRTDVTLIVHQGSYSALWAQENGFSYKYAGQGDDTSWLTGSASDVPVEDTSWLN